MGLFLLFGSFADLLINRRSQSALGIVTVVGIFAGIVYSPIVLAQSVGLWLGILTGVVVWPAALLLLACILAAAWRRSVH